MTLGITHFSRLVFRHFIEATNDPSYNYEKTNLTLRVFWKYHFQIVACLKVIENTTEGVTKRILTSVWRENVVECDFEGFETLSLEPVVNESVSLASIMELEVDNNDIDEFVEEHI
ncbi:hypothetical protein AVEN_253338-1 [Araneus ventricosus]|uniref:DDE-1 domain-containing protein n=1 Tax=Araneus ventricosus TaxID=182803 RepID=A0A4Y2V730_ARAVE|nr:hypothetical protein AVEN_253338-1 [Araneus ventricosus]